MARNVEIKARVADIVALQVRAQALANAGPELIAQDDTFFACTQGRLKLRDFGDGSGELIHYERADDTGPKTSRYVRAATSQPDALREALARAYGVIGRVRKQRTLFLCGRTRIHLDRVEGLGDFVELEVVLSDDEPAAQGEAEAHALMERLGIAPADLVATAYLDLLSSLSSQP